MKLNLQWFAKDGEGGEKTEPATAKKLKDAREALYKFYREHYSLYYAGSPISTLVISCVQRYYWYIDIHVSRDDIEFHLWGDEELFRLNEMLFESYAQSK